MHTEFYDKFYNYHYFGTDDFFDTDYDDYLNTTQKILGALCYVAIGIPLLMIYEVHFKKPIDIIPFSIGNYIHAQYKNIIIEKQEEQDEINIKLISRWNIPKVDCKEV